MFSIGLVGNKYVIKIHIHVSFQWIVRKHCLEGQILKTLIIFTDTSVVFKIFFKTRATFEKPHSYYSIGKNERMIIKLLFSKILV